MCTKLMLLTLLQIVVWPYVSTVNWQADVVFKKVNQLENRIKRATIERKLPNEPILFKFEISDAVEPSEEVKAMLRQDRKNDKTSQAVVPKTIRKRNNTTRNAAGRKTKRNRRSTSSKVFNHESVKLIPFLVSEAREPNEATKVMIKRMRSIELENLQKLAAQQTASKQQQQIKRLRRRSKRSTPKLIPFELADAKFSFNQLKTSRYNRQFKTTDTNSTAKRDLNKNSTIVDDQQIHDTKIHYVFKESPFKLRKAYDAVPAQVQTVMELLKNNLKIGKPYVKHMPMENMDYNTLKASMYNIKYSTRNKYQPIAYVKYLRPYHKKMPMQVMATEAPALLETPIVVSQADEIAPKFVYHEQLTDNKFRPSKPDTYLTAEAMEFAKVPEYQENAIYHKFAKPVQDNNQVYQLKYQPLVNNIKQQEHVTPASIIKVEYHVPANVLQGDYKDYEEFKTLSALIGKSTEDQMHGLTYLLAKEMQNKLNAQQQPAMHTRPQDSTAPILFHPEEKPSEEQGGNSNIQLNSVTEKLIGMAKGKTYIPIVENNAESAEKNTEAEDFQLHSKTDSSRYQLDPSQLKYAVYDGKSNLLTKEPAIKAAEPLKLESSSQQKPSYKTESIKYGINHGDAQYASKYTFGYRIRDFHTGNDFGHKQNRDLHGVTRGQYHILLPDGRIQNVVYHADASGFHADVSFEAGTK